MLVLVCLQTAALLLLLLPEAGKAFGWIPLHVNW
jgi:hypothetical protein